MALHTGSADEREGDYFGNALNRVARLLAIWVRRPNFGIRDHQRVVQGQLPPDATLRDLGAHRLKDLARPEHVYQIDMLDLSDDFAPLRSLDSNQNLTGYLMAIDDRTGARAAAEDVLSFYAKNDPSNPHIPVTLEH